jgi:hypothetical protein
MLPEKDTVGYTSSSLMMTPTLPDFMPDNRVMPSLDHNDASPQFCASFPNTETSIPEVNFMTKLSSSN